MRYFESDTERCSFRADVLEFAGRETTPAEAGRAWRDLIEGRSSVVDAFTASACSYLITTRDVLHTPVSLRSRYVLERVLTGSYPKLVAADLHVAQSTVACTMKQALASIGLSCRPSKVPFGLVALIHAARTDGVHPLMFSRVAQLWGRSCEILAAPMPSLAHLLPPVVEEVLNLHVAGKSHREIALLRGTSYRTIANQLATAFERIGSSGRLSVLDALLSSCQSVQQFGSTG